MLSIKGLVETLQLLRLPHLGTICENEMVDGHIFKMLTEQDLKEKPFNLSGLNLRKALSLKDRNWRPFFQ